MLRASGFGRRPLAVHYASGVSRGRLAGVITEENVLLAVVGVVPGLILGYLATAGFMALFNSEFNSDLFRVV